MFGTRRMDPLIDKLLSFACQTSTGVGHTHNLFLFLLQQLKSACSTPTKKPSRSGKQRPSHPETSLGAHPSNSSWKIAGYILKIPKARPGTRGHSPFPACEDHGGIAQSVDQQLVEHQKWWQKQASQWGDPHHSTWPKTGEDGCVSSCSPW